MLAEIEDTPTRWTPQIPTKVPDALLRVRGWLLWRYRALPGKDKPSKVPYYADGSPRRGAQGSDEDRAALVGFEAASSAAREGRYDGVGLALMPEWGIVALDFDNCVVDGQVLPEVESLVAGTYAEFSPSGSGVRAFMHGHLGNHKSNPPDTYGFEVFSTNGFVTLTGDTLPGYDLLGLDNTVAPLTQAVRDLAARRFGRAEPAASRDAANDDPLVTTAPRLGLTAAQIDTCLTALDPDLPRKPWLDIGMAIHHETDGAGFEHWNAWSSKGSKYTSADDLQYTWDSFGRHGGAPITAATLVKLAREKGARIDLNAPASVDAFKAAAAAPAGEDALQFQFQPLDVFLARTAPPTWFIKGVLPQADIGMLYGESGSGKSFLALDMCLAITRGIPWRTLRTKQARVAYIAAEGRNGIAQRLRAYAQHHGIDPTALPMCVLGEAPNFLHKDDPLVVAQAMRQAQGFDLVVIDTLAQVSPGANENGGEDMGRVLAHCRGLAQGTGAMVLLVHHAGKDTSKGARGWSGLHAAMDTVIEVSRVGGARRARVVKQKDGEDGQEWGFTLQPVLLGVDEDLDPITSCVVQDAAVPVPVKPGRPSKWEQRAEAALGELLLAGAAVSIDQVVARMIADELPPDDGKKDRRREYAKPALEKLCADSRGAYVLENGVIRGLE